MSEPAQSDAHDLASLGYKQELNRSLGSFSSFAAGFSYISILTGMFQTAALGSRSPVAPSSGPGRSSSSAR